MPSAPLASVVVITFNRVALLKECLAALRRQTFKDFEIIVVNGASADGTQQYLATQSDIQVVNQTRNEGLSAGRNAGIRAAKGRIMVFTDDDCAPNEEWLGKLLTPYADVGVAGVGGPVIGLPSHRVFFDRGGVNRFGVVRTIRAGPGFEPYLVGCNASFRRSALDAVGLFDPAFFLCYEETDLCIRLQHAGYRLAFTDEAPLHHHIHVGDKHEPHRFYWKARSRRLFMLKNFHGELTGAGLLAFEVSNLGKNLCRLASGFLRARHRISPAELAATLRGALDGYAAGRAYLRAHGLALKPL